MSSTTDPDEPKKKPGPDADRLVIREEDAEEALDRLLEKKEPPPEDDTGEDEGDGEKKPAAE